MKFSICNELFGGWTWERICKYTSSLGYEGLEVAPFTLAERAEHISAEGRRELRSVAEGHGMQVVGLHWLLVKPAGMYLTHPDPDVRHRASDYFVELVKLCADLGGKVLVIGSPKQRSLLSGVSREQAIGYAAEVFTPVLAPAAEHGVTLAFEPLAPAETDFLNTFAEASELVQRINHPNFSINIDVKAMSSEQSPVPDVIRSAAGRFAHVQVNDPNGQGPGMGEVKFEPIIAALRETGYDGWLSVEAFDFKPGAEMIARKSIEYLKRVTRVSISH